MAYLKLPKQSRTQAAARAQALAPPKPPQPGDQALESGLQAITFVTRLDEKHDLEEPLTRYRSLGVTLATQVRLHREGSQVKEMPTASVRGTASGRGGAHGHKHEA
jgi:hypothetical protein